MATKRLRRLKLNSVVADRLQKQHLTSCQDVLIKSRLELLNLLGVSDSKINHLMDDVGAAATPKSITALELWRTRDSQQYLHTSLSALDHVLHGGLPFGTITEIAGPSGCGKTQLSIMLSVLATLPPEMGGLGGSVLYIDTESAFSADRLVEMAENRFPQYFNCKERVTHLTSNIHIYIESTCASLLNRLENIEEDLISKGVKLVILDSVASLVRKEFDSRGSKNMIDRTNLLAKQATILKYIADTFSIPVVVTNQITTRFGTGVTVEDGDQVSDEGKVSLQTEGYVTAALGNTWSHCVNTRLIVQYLDGPYRQVLVAKSPIAPFANFVYTIQAAGLVLEEDGADHYTGTDPGLQKIRTRAPLPISVSGL